MDLGDFEQAMILADMGKLCRSASRDIGLAMAKRHAERALSESRWLCISDACVDNRGRASIAWGAFSPDGELAAFGSEQIALPDDRSNTLAEALAALRSARAAIDAGAQSAICLSDCRPAIGWLAGKTGTRFDLARQWSQATGGRFELQWAPRDAMGPANDASRAALGLRSEKAKPRRWERYLDDLGVDLANIPTRFARGSSLPRSARDTWTAIADAQIASDGISAGFCCALYNAQGALERQISLRSSIRKGANLADVQAKACEWAAREAARMGAPHALCFTPNPEVARRYDYTSWGRKILDEFVSRLSAQTGSASFRIQHDPSADLGLFKAAAERAAERDASDHLQKCKDMSAFESLFQNWMQRERAAPPRHPNRAFP